MKEKKEDHQELAWREPHVWEEAAQMESRGKHFCVVGWEVTQIGVTKAHGMGCTAGG